MRAGSVLSQYDDDDDDDDDDDGGDDDDDDGDDDDDDGGDNDNGKGGKDDEKTDGGGGKSNSSTQLTLMDVERLIRRNGECLRLSTTLWSLLLLLLRLVRDALARDLLCPTASSK